MKAAPLTIIDYGMGNLWSVLSALRYLGCAATVSGDARAVAAAEALVLPGVGSFRKAMGALRESRLDEAIREAVVARGRKILGICLGMQLLGSRGSEDGDTAGLDLIPAAVDSFSAHEIGARKIPHIGFDVVSAASTSRLFAGLSPTADFYFVHSYRMLADSLPGAASTCIYGVTFLAGYEQDNVFATQFHPEKSQTNGLIVLKNFLAA
jgi:glutamine amidotransferase